MIKQDLPVAVISSKEFSYDVKHRIFTTKSSVLGSKVDLFSFIDRNAGRGFILDFNGAMIPVLVSEILDGNTGWIFYPSDYDMQPIAVHIMNG